MDSEQPMTVQKWNYCVGGGGVIIIIIIKKESS